MSGYEIAKDFQATLAATVALTAATIAYRAAMAKLAFDRTEAEQKRRTEKLALFLRIKYAVNAYASNLGDLRYLIDLEPNDRRDHALKAAIGPSIQIKLPAEINDAWARLDLFTEENMSDLQSMRVYGPIIEKTCNILQPADDLDLPRLKWRCEMASDPILLLINSLDEQIRELKSPAA